MTINFEKIASLAQGSIDHLADSDVSLESIEFEGFSAHHDKLGLFKKALINSGMSEEDASIYSALVTEFDMVCDSFEEGVIGQVKKVLADKSKPELTADQGQFLCWYGTQVFDLDEIDADEPIAGTKKKKKEEPKKTSTRLASARFVAPTGTKPVGTIDGPDRGVDDGSKVSASRSRSNSSNSTDADDYSTNVEDYLDLLIPHIDNDFLRYMVMVLTPAGKERLYKFLARYKRLELSTERNKVDERNRVFELIMVIHKQLADDCDYKKPTVKQEGEEEKGDIERMGYKLSSVQGLGIDGVSDDLIAKLFTELGDTYFQEAMKILQALKSIKDGSYRGDANRSRRRKSAEERKFLRLMRHVPGLGHVQVATYSAADFYRLEIDGVSDEDLKRLFEHKKELDMKSLVSALINIQSLNDEIDEDEDDDEDEWDNENSGGNNKKKKKNQGKRIGALKRRRGRHIRTVKRFLDLVPAPTGITIVQTEQVISAIDALDAPGWVEIRTAALVAFAASQSDVLDLMIEQSEYAYARRRYGHHACERLRRMIRHLRAGALETSEDFQARYFPPKADEEAA
jgi:hypothetical protein